MGSSTGGNGYTNVHDGGALRCSYAMVDLPAMRPLSTCSGAHLEMPMLRLPRHQDDRLSFTPRQSCFCSTSNQLLLLCWTKSQASIALHFLVATTPKLQKGPALKRYGFHSKDSRYDMLKTPLPC